jgi:tripartite-type tricarboxylate transporter receptor subunit TctC
VVHNNFLLVGEAKKMRIQVIRVVLFTAIFAISIANTPTPAADDFYQGKIVRFVVGFEAGGGFDVYTRLIARHISKYIPGNPTTIVMNMPGAGSLVAANDLYARAKPDGLTIGTFAGPLVLQHVLGLQGAAFDGRRFGWLGVPIIDHGVCFMTKASGIKSADEWLASKRPVKIGAAAPGSTTDDIPKILRAALGLPMQVVSGYKGTVQIRLAAETGEVDGGCWGWDSIKPTMGNALASGDIVIVLQNMQQSHRELSHVPMAVTYAKTQESRQLLQVISDAYGITTRPYAVPPGVPQDRLQMLQQAFLDTLKAPDVLAEASKAKMDINPVDGRTTAKVFSSFYDYSPSLISRLKGISAGNK